MKKKVFDKFVEVCEAQDWTVRGTHEDKEVELEKYSPAGEDFSITIDLSDVKESTRSAYDSFDEDDHIEMWIEARKNGVSGVPSTRELVKDADDIKNMLEDLAIAVAAIKE